MAKNEVHVLQDGWSNTLGGVDSTRAPNLLGKNVLAFAVNATLRGGHAETRPPFVRLKLNFDTEEIEEWWESQHVQVADYFQPDQNNPLIIASIGGRIFEVDILDGGRVSEITPTKETSTVNIIWITPPLGTSGTLEVADASLIQVGLPILLLDGVVKVTAKTNNVLTYTNLTANGGVIIPIGTPIYFLDVNPTILPQAWTEVADKYFLLQDGQSACFVYDGATNRRADITTHEVPTGTVMVFNEEIGRLCVAIPDNQIAIGDVLGGPTSVLKFTENTYMNEGGPFRIPKKYGRITGGTMVANLDRANGQGAMLFTTERGITAFNLPANRDTWKTVSYPVQINMPIKGAMSDDSLLPVNGDVFYRGRDGLRTVAMTRQEFGGRWGNVPLSRELGRILDWDDQYLLRFSSSVVFDNRLLFTVTPQPDGHGSAYWNGLGVLDLDVLSTMGDQLPPVYDGIWSGVKPVKMVTGEFAGNERCFMFTRNASGGVELWEILKRGNFDGDDGRIVSWIETRAMDCAVPLELKRLSDCELWVDRVAGTVDFNLKYRSDQYPCWFDWGTKQRCQKHKDCDEETADCTVSTFRPGYRSRMAFGQPPDTDETTDNKPARNFYNAQLRLQWTGRARIKWGLIKATRIAEAATQKVD